MGTDYKPTGCLYFTFGSDPTYPYGRDDYVVALGTDAHDCIEAFRKRHPNRPGSDAYNAASSYKPDRWVEIYQKYYGDRLPVEVIVSDNVYGCRPDGFGALWIHIPVQHALMHLRLEPCCIARYDIFILGEDGMPKKDTAYENGIIQLDYLPSHRYSCLTDLIPVAMEHEYGTMFMPARILEVAEWKE